MMDHPARVEAVDALPAVLSPPASRRQIVATVCIAAALHITLLGIEAATQDDVATPRRLAIQLAGHVQTVNATAPATAQTRERPATLPTNTAPPTLVANDATAMPGPQMQAIPIADTAGGENPEPEIVEARVDTAYLDNPKPVYPPLSRRLGEEGTVLLKVDVSAAGAVTAVAVERSAGYARLDEAARKTVMRWRFVAARRGEENVASTVLVPVTFALATVARQ